MQYRTLGRTGWDISAVSFGAWAIGGTWGEVDDDTSLQALHTAIDQGVNFIDTADVYGDGRSERLISKLLKERTESIYVATKLGRRLNPHKAEGYNRENLTDFVDRSLKNLEVDTIDLIQLHCPPTEVYYMPEVFGIMDDLVQAGKLRYYGVSVEKVEEALKAIEYPNVQTVQIIFNMLRHRPAERLFRLAQERQVGIIVRVPLSSGLLTGKITRETTFPEDDHRNFNRHGAAFDVGETFSGLEDFDRALQAVDEIKAMKPDNMTMAQFALRWILMFNEVTCTIPGAKTPQQALDNTAAADLPMLDDAVMRRIREVYDTYAREQVHHRW
ncbi:MAG: aldo/keto reductase [Chloroflexota bacterium]